MNIRKALKEHIDEAEIITEETIQEILESRKTVKSDEVDEKYRQQCIKNPDYLDESKIRKDNPVGDKKIFAIVYPPFKRDTSKLSVEVVTVLESELDEFAETHTLMDQQDSGSSLPRFQKIAQLRA